MSRIILAPTASLLALLLLLLAPPAQAKKNKITRETLQSGGEERSYVLFVPVVVGIGSLGVLQGGLIRLIVDGR